MIDKIKKWYKKFRCPHLILETEEEGIFCFDTKSAIPVITAKLPYENKTFDLLIENFNVKQKVTINTNEYSVNAYITSIEINEYNNKKYIDLYFLVHK